MNLIKVIRQVRNMKRPRESSSLKPVHGLRVSNVKIGSKASRIDPRFSNGDGEFDGIRFHEDYGFIDGMRREELNVIQY